MIAAARRPYWAPEPDGSIELVVFGGSQGARFFSESLPLALARLPADVRARLHIVQQARIEDVSKVGCAYRDARDQG